MTFTFIVSLQIHLKLPISLPLIHPSLCAICQDHSNEMKSVVPYQTGVPCSSPHAWWNLQKHGCWNGMSWHRGFERWRKRTGRSDSSWANRRAWLPSLPRVTMATSSGWHRQTPVQRTWRTQQRNGPITASVLARPPPRSVRLDGILHPVRCENK